MCDANLVPFIKFTLLPSTWLFSQPPELVSQQGTGPCWGPQPVRGSAYEVSLDAYALLWPCGWESPSPPCTLGSDWREAQAAALVLAINTNVERDFVDDVFNLITQSWSWAYVPAWSCPPVNSSESLFYRQLREAFKKTQKSAEVTKKKTQHKYNVKMQFLTLSCHCSWMV